jgi:hypothetical protein
MWGPVAARSGYVVVAETCNDLTWGYVFCDTRAAHSVTCVCSLGAMAAGVSFRSGQAGLAGVGAEDDLDVGLAGVAAFGDP